MAILFINGYPLVAQNTTGTSIVASGAINQSGMIYSVIVPAASGAPSAQQIYDGQNEDSTALAANLICSGEASASGVEVTLSGYSLTSETAYTIYVTASGYDDGLYGSGEPVNFTTPDITAPSWSGSYPSLATAYGTSGTFNLAVNEADCSGFVYIVASGADAPSSAHIIASGEGVALTLADTVYQVTATGLTSETNYTAYIVAEDDVPNIQTSGEAVYFTTGDITAPTWLDGFPSVSGITTSTAQAYFGINDAGSGYGVVLPAAYSTPSAAQIIAGTDADDGAIYEGWKPSDTVLVANTPTSAPGSDISQLSYGQYYTLHCVCVDDGGNQSAVSSVNFRAAVPPAGVGGYYSIKNIQKEEGKRKH